MARKNGEAEFERSKVRIFYAEAEGTPQSIQDLLRGLTAAIGRPATVVSPRLVAPNPTHTNGSQANGHSTTPAAEPDLFNSVDAGMEQPSNGESVEDEPIEQPRRKRGEGNTRDRNAGLSIVKSLNLMPEGKESLKAFVAGKKPENQMEHIAVYIYYLKVLLEEPKVTFSHILTCFDAVNEAVPGDLPQSCRNAASKKGWIDTSDQDDLKTTTAGVNLVKHQLPAASAGTAS